MPTPLEPRELKGDVGREVYFGMLLESEDPRVVSAAVRDLHAYRTTIDSRDRLIVATNTPDLLKPTADSLGEVSVILYLETMAPRTEFRIWKAYYVTTEPVPPQHAELFFSSKVGTDDQHVLRFDRGYSPVPDEPAGVREVPPGTSLTINKLPPRINYGTPWMPMI
jgi:hypothetical protein